MTGSRTYIPLKIVLALAIAAAAATSFLILYGAIILGAALIWFLLVGWWKASTDPTGVRQDMHREDYDD